MAYITTETVAKIRNALKEEFPNCKFSVRRRDRGLAVAVSIMRSPFDFSNLKFNTINEFHIDQYVEQIGQPATAFLKRIDEIIRVVGDHYDKSDMQSDYFNVAFYYDITIGNDDKDHKTV